LRGVISIRHRWLQRSAVTLTTPPTVDMSITLGGGGFLLSIDHFLMCMADRHLLGWVHTLVGWVFAHPPPQALLTLDTTINTWRCVLYACLHIDPFLTCLGRFLNGIQQFVGNQQDILVCAEASMIATLDLGWY
jgi:hypothetical protein